MEHNKPTVNAETHYRRACAMSLEELKKDVSFLQNTVEQAKFTGQASQFVTDLKIEFSIKSALLNFKEAKPIQKEYYMNVLNSILAEYMKEESQRRVTEPAPIGNPQYQNPYPVRRNSA